MALRVVQAPGCRAIYSDDELGVTAGDVVIALLPEHRSATVIMHFDPIRGADGSLQVDHLLPDSPDGVALAASVRSGARPGLSVEFHALDEAQVQGVREVRQSLVTAVATVPSQSYDQAKAEVRSTTRVVAWWRR